MTLRNKIRTVAGFAHAEPKYYGLDWEVLRPLLDEHEGLARKSAEINARISELEGRLKDERGALPQKRAEAMRAGKGSVSTKHLDKIEAEISEARESLEDIKRAANLVDRDLQAELEKHAPAFVEEIDNKRMVWPGRAHEIRRQLAAVEWEMDALQKVRDYLINPNRRTGRLVFKGTGPRPEIAGESVEPKAGDDA